MESKTLKCPKGQSYAIKPLMLNSALEAANVDIDTSLKRGPGRRFLDAHFWIPNQNVPYERLYITSGTVPSIQAVEAREFVEVVAIPKLVHWISEILSLDSRSTIRREKQRISFSRAARFWKIESTFGQEDERVIFPSQSHRS